MMVNDGDVGRCRFFDLVEREVYLYIVLLDGAHAGDFRLSFLVRVALGAYT